MAGANDRIRVGVCGIRGQGFQHVEEYSRLDNVEVAAVCDVDENIIRARLADMERLGIPKPKVYSDPRQVMDDKSIDAVSIATPNHWHAQIVTSACQWLGVPGRQGRLRRKALLALLVGGAPDGARRREIQPHRATRRQQPL